MNKHILNSDRLANPIPTRPCRTHASATFSLSKPHSATPREIDFYQTNKFATHASQIKVRPADAPALPNVFRHGFSAAITGNKPLAPQSRLRRWPTMLRPLTSSAAK